MKVNQSIKEFKSTVMILELFLGLTGALVVASMMLVAVTAIKTQLACKQFKVKSKGMQMVEDFRPITGHLTSLVFKPDMNNHIMKLRDKYSDTIFIMYGSTPFVITFDLDLIKTIVLDEQQVNINRTPNLNIPMKEVNGDSMLLASDDKWRRLRRAVAPAFTKLKFTTPNVVKETNDSINKLMKGLERKIEQSPNGSIELNVDDYLHRYTLDLTLSCLFKQNKVVDFDSPHDKMTREIDLGFSDIFKNPLFIWTIVFPILGRLVDRYLLDYFKAGSSRQLTSNFIKLQTRANLEARKEIQSMRVQGKKNINEENLILKDGTKFNRNMIDHVIDHYHDGKISKVEYFHTTFFLLNAADKTSADALSQTLYRLALNPDKQDKLRESIREKGVDSTYLSWVIHETLRLQPPATNGCSRAVERDTETRHGTIIPKGTFVVTPAYAIHRLEEYWGRDASEFRPERFADQKSFHPCQYMPFGAGLRGCPGKEFALYEMKSVLVELIKKYHFSCRPKKTEGYDAPFFIMRIPHQPTIIRLTKLQEV